MQCQKMTSSQCVVIIAAAVFLSLSAAAAFKYSTPDFCRWIQASPNSPEVSVVCTLSTLQENVTWHALQSDGTVSLRIQCAESAAPSTLSNLTISHLHELRELGIETCNFASIPPRAFEGLRQLRNLTLQTRRSGENAAADTTSTLTIQTDSFAGLTQLERLDLSQNGISTLPSTSLCSIRSLQQLNVTQNRLVDIADVTSCRLDLTTLDASHNDIRTLAVDSFATLPRLVELFLQENRIANVAERTLAGLGSLRVVNLSGNDLTSLPPELFGSPNSTTTASELVELYLSNNSLEVLGPGLFGGLQQLLVLDLSQNRLGNNWVTGDTFADLIRLVVLNLSHNRLNRIDAGLFRNLYSLQILELAHNRIEYVADHAFAAMFNLHTLVLGHNRITKLDRFTLDGLYVLSLLSANDNRIDSVHREAFRNCSHLQDLHLNGNELESVPEAIGSLRFLKTLDLGENRIANLGNASFRGMQQLHGLRLIDNRIGNVTKGAFDDMPALRILNLARNAIEAVEPGTFDANRNLHAIRLDSNLLSDINGLFANLPALMWLNISANRLTWFDYALVPLGLQWLDVHANLITSLGNYFKLESKSQLQTLDASLNRIGEIGAANVPDAIQLLFINDNRIGTVQPYTFYRKSNLTRVDLFGNRIESLDLNAVRLSPVPEDRPVPEFYLGGNPFRCDCRMAWLQRVNELASQRHHPRIMDLESIYCRLLDNRNRAFVPLVEVRPAHFLCAYADHCYSVCQCCEYDACDCKMTCPQNCTCYHNQDWSANIVSCAGSGYARVPDDIPMDATDVYLDGNVIGTLASHAFIGRKNMAVLFLNASRIAVIQNRTFNGLPVLRILHLEHNVLSELRGYEFEHLERLRELHLNDNRLTHVSNVTFLPLKSLELLRIDGNRLVHFRAWNSIVSPLLVTLSLARNPWSCACRFVGEFRTWLARTRGGVVDDANAVRCQQLNGSVVELGGAAACDNSSGVGYGSGGYGNGGNYYDDGYGGSNVNPAQTPYETARKPLDAHIPLLVGCLSLSALLVVVALLAFRFRYDVAVRLHARYGIRLCGSGGGGRGGGENTAVGESSGKLFDAFVSYSSKDEGFVMQVLAPELEFGEPPYTLCLHYRDFPVGAYVGDTIVEAIESSSRTILLLSENFIKSEWCRFEFKSAHHQVLKDRRRRLIVIVLGDVAQRDLDPDIRLYLKSNSYLRWGDKRFWDKLRYALPDARIKNRDNSTRSVSIHI